MGSLRRSHATAAKLTNANGFSKNAYDDVFAAGSRKNNLGGGGASNLGSGGGVEDYNEIFGASLDSSIPTLDLSALEEMNASDDVWSSKVDYKKVFGGFKEDDIGVSYEQLFAATAAAAKRGKSSSNKARNQAETGSPLQASSRVNCSAENQLFSSEASSQVLNCAKQFSMSYHKTGQRSNDTNGTTHITQLRAIPGFTCFIDETTPMQRPDVDKLKPSLINEVPHAVALKEKTISQDHLRLDVSPFTKKQSFRGVVRSRSGSRAEGSFSDDEFFNAHEISSKVQASLCQSVGLDNKKNSLKTSVPSNFGASMSDVSGDCSSPFSDEELDISSNAAASIAALRKALRQAEESIRLAKESMERRGNCLQGFQDQRFKDSLKIEDRGTGRNAHEDDRIEEKNAKETYGRMHPVFQEIDGTNGTKAFRTCETASDLRDSQKLSASAKIAGKTLEANVKPIQECDCVPAITEKHKMEISASDQVDCRIDIMQTIGKYESQFTEMKMPTETVAQQECVVGNVKVDEDTCRVKNNMEENLNAVEKVKQGKEQVNEVESACFVHEDEEEIKGGITQKCIEKEEKQGGFYEQENSEKKIVVLQEETVVRKFDLPDLNENNDGKCLNQVQELEEVEEKPEATKEEQIEEDIDAHEKDVNETVCNEEEIEKNIKVFGDQVDGSDGGIPIISSDCEEIGKRLKETWQKIYNVITTKEACVSESAERTQVNSDEGKETEGRSEDTHEREIDMKSSRNIQDVDGGEERLAKQYGLQGEETFKDTERLPRQTHHSTDNKKIEVTGETICKIVSDTSSDVGMHDDASENKIYGKNMESCQDVASQENRSITKSPKAVLEVNEDKDQAAAAIMAFWMKEFETLNASGPVHSAAENDEINNQRQDAFEATHKYTENSTDMDIRRQQIENNEEQPELEFSIQNGIEFLIDDYGENVEDVKDSNAIDKEVVNNNSGMLYEEGHWVAEGKKSEASQHFNLSNGKETEVDNTMETSQTSTNTESNEENLPKTTAMADKEAEENVEEADRQRLRKVGEANRKRREWEKDRIAVERAIREARERAFTEARERAERAAVERANAEVRQRVLTEAREKLEKASAGTKPSADRVSVQAKLRAERAAVERATAEARERALEKALSQKATSGARTQVGDKFSGASQDNGIKQTFYSCDFDKSDGANNESAQRRKAKLERHQRVMERAAKALAEKNKRDLLAQKEQAERNRLAEVLDADIKRWASGKEGNLRALLSTLQYILGPNSGWQPISLTDIITTNAVKKAYRKATLYVHPDKLQQRGATIQQKYTCEKVFDLLKAAWNRFNSEER